MRDTTGPAIRRALKGEAILLEARIIACADVVEAIASHRPYRPSVGIDAALREIEENQGVFYDPRRCRGLSASVSGKGVSTHLNLDHVSFSPATQITSS